MASVYDYVRFGAQPESVQYLALKSIGLGYVILFNALDWHIANCCPSKCHVLLPHILFYSITQFKKISMFLQTTKHWWSAAPLCLLWLLPKYLYMFQPLTSPYGWTTTVCHWHFAIYVCAAPYLVAVRTSSGLFAVVLFTLRAHSSHVVKGGENH